MRIDVLLGALGVSLFTASSALAFCHTTTCNPTDAAQACEKDADNCVVSGKPLFWPDACVSFSVTEGGSPLRGISYDQAADVIGQGFAAWVGANCGGDAPAINFVQTRGVTCDTIEYNKRQPNANVWMFRDDEWPYDSSVTIALTTVTFNVDSGEIYDADVELNSAQHQFSVGTPVRTDLLSVVTHEAGHFLGLSHSPKSTATMFRDYRDGTTELRSLEQDDVDGVCETYPPGRNPGVCNPEPRHGFSTTCGTDQAEQGSSGCSVRLPDEGDRRAPAGLATLALAAVALARRSRRRA